LEKKINSIGFNYTIALFVILLINLILKWRFFCGLNEADDFSYAVYAFSLGKIPIVWDMNVDFRVFRFSLIFPVFLLYKIFPPSELIAVIYPILISFGTIILIYHIGKRLYGPNAAIIGALVLATFPADLIHSTMLLPDTLVPFFVALSVFFFLKAEDSSDKKTLLWYFVSGLSIYFAFISRENSFYFFFFFFPFIFDKKRWINGIYLMGVAFALAVIINYSIFYIKTGDFFYNIHLSGYHRDLQVKSGYIPPNKFNMINNLFFMLPIFFKKITQKYIFFNSLFGAIFYFGIPCIVYTTVKALKKKNYFMLLAPWWFLTVYLFLEFGSISFTEYQTMKKLSRFLITLTPAMALCCGVFITDAFGLGIKSIDNIKKTKIRWLTAIPVSIIFFFILFSSFNTMKMQKESRKFNMECYRWAYYEILKDKPHKPLYTTGGWWTNKLSFFFLPDIRYADMPWRRSDMFRDLKSVKNPDDLSDSYIILDKRNFTGNNDLGIKHEYDDFGSYVKIPPKDWKLLGSMDHIEIYDIPQNWKYIEPDGKEFVLSELFYALKTRDITLFLNSMHPDFLKSIDQNQLQGLANILANDNDPKRAELLNNRLIYKELNNQWKITFKLD